MKHLHVRKGAHLSEKAWKPRPDFGEKCSADSCVAEWGGAEAAWGAGRPRLLGTFQRPAAVLPVREGTGQLPRSEGSAWAALLCGQVGWAAVPVRSVGREQRPPRTVQLFFPQRPSLAGRLLVPGLALFSWKTFLGTP